MSCIIKDEATSTYYQGTDTYETITLEHFTTTIELALVFSFEYEALLTVHSTEMPFLTLVELPNYHE